ncbi:Sulfate adenylyltransferase subunit 1 (fragment) [Candidatus Accumulibacter aalborgensis]|uniref:Sulfate adenylyltransferase subunit 1 n=1 Tax=Candidatus Accumulibacter aalborgensis TaxID=1860102 RepID=A0A1A8Y065_9PROT
MVTAASTADLAIILIDARKGVLTQTRRHSYLAHLVGIGHIVVAVNKMDLVDYAPETFARIKADYLAFAAGLGIADVRFIPLSALNGDMIVDRGEHLDWYEGPTLFEILETVPAIHSEHAEKFRFPVQYVCRPQDSANPELHDYRGFMGRVESGELPKVAKQIDAMLCWRSESPLDPRRKYLLRHTTRDSKAMLAGIAFRVDINTLEQQSAEKLVMNDITRVSFKLAQPILDQDLDRIADGGTAFRLVIGEYGSGKTFFRNLVRGEAMNRLEATSVLLIFMAFISCRSPAPARRRCHDSKAKPTP